VSSPGRYQRADWVAVLALPSLPPASDGAPDRAAEGGVKAIQAHIDGSGRISMETARDEIRDRLYELRGQHVGIRIEPYKNIRSQEANAYLWGHVYAEMAKHSGHSAEELHDLMCAKFLPNEKTRAEFYSRLTGEVLELEADGRRSSKLSGNAFYDFVEAVRQFAVEFLGVVTQDPDPDYWRKRVRRAA
jgi:hypothetical protein